MVVGLDLLMPSWLVRRGSVGPDEGPRAVVQSRIGPLRSELEQILADSGAAVCGAVLFSSFRLAEANEARGRLDLVAGATHIENAACPSAGMARVLADRIELGHERLRLQR